MKTLRILSAAGSEWNDWISRAEHDFYDTAEYHGFSEDQGQGQAFLAVYGDTGCFVAWPYLLRDIGITGGEMKDVGSVYGYSGPICQGCERGSDFVEEALSRIEDGWREQGAVTAFSRLHPLLENQRWVADHAREWELVQHGHTVAIDLALPAEEVLRNYNRKLRQELRYAREAGVETFIDENWDYFDDFVRLYHDTMSRNGAAEWYYFSEDYLRQFSDAMGSHAVLRVATCGRRVIAACIFVEFGECIQAHLEGADHEYLPVSPFKVLIDDERVRGQQAGRKWLHLGGGRGGAEDNLFTVKRRFSPIHMPFYTFRKVLRQDAYDELIRCRRTEALSAGQVFEPNGFFPAYRAPVHEKQLHIGAAS